MKQEVCVQLDISIELDAKYSDKEVREIVERGACRCFPNNPGIINSLRYAEERHLYGPGAVEWQVLRP